MCDFNCIYERAGLCLLDSDTCADTCYRNEDCKLCENKMYGECEEQTNMKKSCENCKYLLEIKDGEHCKNCIHNAKDNFEPVQNKKRSD